jgi:hypothetical protein
LLSVVRVARCQAGLCAQRRVKTGVGAVVPIGLGRMFTLNLVSPAGNHLAHFFTDADQGLVDWFRRGCGTVNKVLGVQACRIKPLTATGFHGGPGGCKLCGIIDVILGRPDDQAGIPQHGILKVLHSILHRLMKVNIPFENILVKNNYSCRNYFRVTSE